MTTTWLKHFNKLCNKPGRTCELTSKKYSQGASVQRAAKQNHERLPWIARHLASNSTSNKCARPEQRLQCTTCALLRISSSLHRSMDDNRCMEPVPSVLRSSARCNRFHLLLLLSGT